MTFTFLYAMLAAETCCVNREEEKREEEEERDRERDREG